MRALFQHARLIRLPVNVEEQCGRFIRTQRQLTQKLERKPEPHEIAGEMALSVEQVTKIQTLLQPPVSLESQIGLPEDGNTLKDVIEDKDAVSPVESLRMKRQLEQTRALVSKLNHRERMVITMRFGLDDGEPKSLETVGKQLGLNEVGWKKWTPKFGKIFNGGVTYEKCPKGEIHEGISRRGG